MNRLTQIVLTCTVLMCATVVTHAEMLKPFFLGSSTVANFDETILNVKKSLENEGFEIIADFSPYQHAHLVIVSNPTLRKIALNAVKNDCKAGVLVAAQRVSITQVKHKVQVAYTDPVYMGVAYQVSDSLEGERYKLAKALGRQKYFGSKEGISDDDLGDYHYTFGMEYCKDYSGQDLISGQPLGQHSNYKDALKTINRSLRDNLGGTVKVYQMDLDTKKQVSIFGIRFTQEDFSSDKRIMSIIDKQPYRHTAHLPYELFVIGNKSWALHPRFRIAINFPDLEMAGKVSFMKIIEAPDAISKSLIMGVGGEVDDSDDDDEFF